MNQTDGIARAIAVVSMDNFAGLEKLVIYQILAVFWSRDCHRTTIMLFWSRFWHVFHNFKF